MILDKVSPCLRKLKLRFWTYGYVCLLGLSGPNVVTGPQSPRSRHFLRFHDSIGFIYDSWENEVLFVKIGARVLGLWLDVSSGLKWPKCYPNAPDPKVKKFFEISWFYWIHFIILKKMMPCLSKMELGFWTYGLMCLWVQVGPDPKVKNVFKKFNDFHGFIYIFLNKMRSFFWKLQVGFWTYGVVSPLSEALGPIITDPKYQSFGI